MNILTFDIEEWVIEKERYGGRPEKYSQFNEILDDILNKLDERNIKATFFCLGQLARDFPEVVRKIADRGHEIGCHSDKHLWLNKMSKEEVDEDTRLAVSSLETLTGSKIRSYRAPAFSIGESNKWAFDILARYGVEIDASVFPMSRDFGGWPSFGHKTPVEINLSSGRTIKEFPIAPGTLFRKSVVFSGGGYFRLMPLFLTKKMMKRMDYTMFYFHINDFIPEQKKFMSKQRYEEYFKETGTFVRRLKRYIKSNIGTGDAKSKLYKLIASETFVNIAEAELKLKNNL